MNMTSRNQGNSSKVFFCVCVCVFMFVCVRVRASWSDHRLGTVLVSAAHRTRTKG